MKNFILDFSKWLIGALLVLSVLIIVGKCLKLELTKKFEKSIHLLREKKLNE